MRTAHSDRPPQEKICGYEYTVRRGDSFYLIANRLGIPLRDLLEANSDINPARLMVGDVLCIPMEEDDAPPLDTPEESPALPPEESLPEELPPEEPLPEDDLDTPAVDEEMRACPQQHLHTVQPDESAADIQLRRNINRYTLQNANPATNLDTLQAGQVLCVPESNIPCPAERTYTLQQGETLESTALRLNTSLSALLRANPCLAPADFVAGRCIFVPE